MCACAGSPAGHHPVRAGRLLDAAAREAAHHAAGLQPRHQGRGHRQPVLRIRDPVPF